MGRLYLIYINALIHNNTISIFHDIAIIYDKTSAKYKNTNTSYFVALSTLR